MSSRLEGARGGGDREYPRKNAKAADTESTSPKITFDVLTRFNNQLTPLWHSAACFSHICVEMAWDTTSLALTSP